MRVGLLAPLLLVAACSGGGRASETLEPLPIEGGTPAPPPTAPPPPSTDFVASPATVTTTTRAPASVPAPFGEWDGAQFDVGVIETVSENSGYTVIGFDRYSFNDPELGTIDAVAFEDEPVAAWWRTSPYTNVRVLARTFVLDPDVEILVLSESGRQQACAEPPPATAPEPAWEEAGVELLDDPAASGRIAILTYSSTGQVTRIRFTAGC
jgi:hypothetical protein